MHEFGHCLDLGSSRRVCEESVGWLPESSMLEMVGRWVVKCADISGAPPTQPGGRAWAWASRAAVCAGAGVGGRGRRGWPRVRHVPNPALCVLPTRPPLPHPIIAIAPCVPCASCKLPDLVSLPPPSLNFLLFPSLPFLPSPSFPPLSHHLPSSSPKSPPDSLAQIVGAHFGTTVAPSSVALRMEENCLTPPSFLPVSC
jgi:hypothetical protein